MAKPHFLLEEYLTYHRHRVPSLQEDKSVGSSHKKSEVTFSHHTHTQSKKALLFSHLPSFCPSPVKALKTLLGFTYSSSRWSSISRFTCPPRANLRSSAGTSLQRQCPIKLSWKSKSGTAPATEPNTTTDVWNFRNYCVFLLTNKAGAHFPTDRHKLKVTFPWPLPGMTQRIRNSQPKHESVCSLQNLKAPYKPAPLPSSFEVDLQVCPPFVYTLRI